MHRRRQPTAPRPAPSNILHRSPHRLPAPSSFFRRTPGPRDHRALGGNQKDIKPIIASAARRVLLFKRTRASCQRKAHCAEIRSVTTATPDRKSTRLNSSHVAISYAVFCLKKKNRTKKK